MLILLLGHVPAWAQANLQAVLAVRTREPAREVAPRLITEVTGHLHRTISDLVILHTSKGPGRFVMTVSFPQDERLKFEKMVVELPTVAFSVPVAVDSWNISHRAESVGASDETTAAFSNFRIELTETGVLSTVKLREVPVRDVLAYLARTAHLQYICPSEISERLVWADLRDVTLDEFLKGLKTSLGIDLQRSGTFYILYKK